jgi:acetoin:2,6-dichlorophenolindophenol oxidoreductase subunit alpha
MTELSKEKLLQVYERMQLIRAFENKASALFAEGKLAGFVHLYAGEEAIGVGVCSHLTDADFITSTHRGHGHCIAKGVEVKPMMAELYGKVTGSCKGKGGSMHIADVDKGMMGANGIVGAGGPLACGSGLMAKVKGTDQVTICFFGDGASEQGTMHEGMNMAKIWKLPVVFVCENNGFAESTPQSYHCSAKDIADRATAYNMPGFTVDGTDFFAVHEAAGEAIARARRGEGPSLLECKAFRYYGHFEGDAKLYYTEAMQEDFKKRDPITRFRQRVLDRNLVSEDDLAAIDAKVKQAIEDAVKFGEESPYPALEDCLTDVYVAYA